MVISAIKMANGLDLPMDFLRDMVVYQMVAKEVQAKHLQPQFPQRYISMNHIPQPQWFAAHVALCPAAHSHEFYWFIQSKIMGVPLGIPICAFMTMAKFFHTLRQYATLSDDNLESIIEQNTGPIIITQSFRLLDCLLDRVFMANSILKHLLISAVKLVCVNSVKYLLQKIRQMKFDFSNSGLELQFKTGICCWDEQTEIIALITNSQEISPLTKSKLIHQFMTIPASFKHIRQLVSSGIINLQFITWSYPRDSWNLKPICLFAMAGGTVDWFEVWTHLNPKLIDNMEELINCAATGIEIEHPLVMMFKHDKKYHKMKSAPYWMEKALSGENNYFKTSHEDAIKQFVEGIYRPHSYSLPDVRLMARMQLFTVELWTAMVRYCENKNWTHLF